ncbi:VWA domain-containing protein [Streptomyces sp. LD120]|uniref:VWA domain-containing protein n=1 Tax=Streptomyces physcomitrii TaxID=2724184 RepID=A0ABX1HDB9_9ACTN|nr:VWA domain-containing protein [Streptomyces physcomitrii]
MGRHNLPEEYGPEATQPHPGVRRRAVAIATVLVLTVTAGGAVAYSGGWLSGSSCEDDAVGLSVAASPDMAPALQAAADYSRENEITSDGRCMDIKVVSQDSFKTAGLLRMGKNTGFDVWVPDSQMWVQGTSDSGAASPLTTAGNVASTPLAVAAVPSAADKLGWPQKTYSWDELAEVAIKGDKAHVGTANPSLSATGLLALTELGAAPDGGDGRSRGVEVAGAIQKHIAAGDTTAADSLARDGQGKGNDALVLSEQASFTHNTKSKGTGGDLSLFYPKDGSPQLDYPYTLIDESEMSTDESRAALRFMTLLGEQEGKRILHEHGFRTNADEPSAELVTAAGGRSPQPYDDSDGEQPSPGEIQESLGIWTITAQSARLTTVIDASSSMADMVPELGGSRMSLMKNSLREGLKTFSEGEDEIGLWDFASDLDGDRDYRKIVDTKRITKSHVEDLEAGYEKLAPEDTDETGLYDTVLAAYKDATSHYVDGKFNTVIVVTDGGNDTGELSRSALLRRLAVLAKPGKPVPVIMLTIGPDADKDDAAQIAEATHGSSHEVEDPSKINSVILKAIMEAGIKAQQ